MTQMNSHDVVAKDFKEFAYVVSHDLGAPLRAVVEFSQLLQHEHGDVLTEESELYLAMILRNGRRAQEMLSGLLEYSRLNTVVMPLAETDCSMLAHECVQGLSGLIEGRQARITLGPLPTLAADANQLQRLITSLLTNALIYSRVGVTPIISLTAEKYKNEYIFCVQDNGIGIDAKFHEKIFQPFRRLHSEGEYPGIGMGLTLARKILDRHEGRIWVESRAKCGAAFYFSLPIARQ